MAVEPLAGNSSSRGSALSGPLPAVTIFVSAFLLFQVQPLIARIILPSFGGSAAVWTTCLLFFQVVLLLGYGYSHTLAERLPPARQAMLHSGLLILSALLLHIMPRAHGPLPPSGDPTGRILLMLLITVGLPYFLLSTTGPLLQSWLAREGEVAGGGKALYRLYALSNAASLLALLSYPVAEEPLLAIRQQARAWSAGYLLFVVLVVAVAWQARRLPAVRQEASGGDGTDGARPSLGLHLAWLGLAAIASTMLLAVTNHLSQNVAAIPFLWVLPLSLYLLTFILCFGPREWQWSRAFLPLPALALVAMAYALSRDSDILGLRVLIPVYAFGLFIACMLCHGELARLKPPPRYLTSFYLMMSAGGALGGIFVALLAPHLFNAYYELPLAIGACAVVAWLTVYRDGANPWGVEWLSLGGLTVMLLAWLWTGAGKTGQGYRLVRRNFYGMLRVGDSGTPGSDAWKRSLTNGTILHGEQFLKPSRHMLPTTYYAPTTGVGLAVREAQARGPVRVGVIGLGAGTLLSYGRTGDFFRFYDINPLVVDVAMNQFSFVRDTKALLVIVPGDARLSLEFEPPQQFDVLAVDAFSGDAIPVHLLTKEAMELYFRHLRPGGILAVHVSNRYLDLGPVVANLAASLGKTAMEVSNEDEETSDTSAASWILVTDRRSFFKNALLKSAAVPVNTRSGLRTWTDDYSNLYQILK